MSYNSGSNRAAAETGLLNETRMAAAGLKEGLYWEQIATEYVNGLLEQGWVRGEV